RKNYKGHNDLTTWTVNPEFSSKICFCVDAGTWTTANVAFHMKQTYNLIYSSNRGFVTPFTSNLRILVNGIQIGNTYNPTKNTDPYRLNSVNLEDYAGTKFELCFEAKTYQSKAYDSNLGGFGDNVYLDNIFFSEIPVGVKEITESTIHFEVYPNPGKDLFTLSCFSKNAGIINIEIVDMLGRNIYNRKLNVNYGNNSIPVEIKSQQAGIYIISVLSADNKEVKKLIIE
ncbi:MAG: T9SS type A sorting domain-containing protein, partial [Bacteroidetes bacterium]|nr:T9SS type A sorting domain-containing protein [Bacteroidota bacterium]